MSKFTKFINWTFFGHCNHSVNVITLGLSQSDHNMRLPLLYSLRPLFFKRKKVITFFGWFLSQFRRCSRIVPLFRVVRRAYTFFSCSNRGSQLVFQGTRNLLTESKETSRLSVIWNPQLVLSFGYWDKKNSFIKVII